MQPFSLSRRRALFGLTALSGFGLAMPGVAFAKAPGERRFVVVILRGALDGLSAVVPYGDPDLAALRPELIPPMPGQENGLLDLGGMFGLHPALVESHAMYQAGEFLVVHAVAGGYRLRSHFEAQDILESGGEQRLSNGWLNRAAQLVPDRGGSTAQPRAIAVGASVPLILRGNQAVANWAPHAFTEPRQTLYQSIQSLNQADPLTGPAITAGMRDRGFGNQMAGETEKGGARFAFPALAKAAGHLLRTADGPRIAALEIGGWDTHTFQMNRIAGPLAQLDAGLGALKSSLGDTWEQTVVLAMTEFGRTARMNGTQGTDHGTATVAFVAGGSVSGGRIVANWPGLGAGRLYENRDLAPTTDLRAVAKGLLASHLGHDNAALNIVFPGADSIAPMQGLMRTT